jgi:hypothetical protein
MFVKEVKFVRIMNLNKIVILQLCLSLLACGGGSSVSDQDKDDDASDDRRSVFSVSGSVVVNGGDGVAGIQIGYGDAESTQTDVNGLWSVAELEGETIIAPVSEDYTFSPVQVAVAATSQNIEFTASLIESPVEIERYVEKINNWFNNQQVANGLVASAENSKFVSLYDNALAALVFINNGNIANAEKVFDHFNARIDAELLAGEGGFSQFRDTSGAHENHRWMGDNAWLLIALNHYKSTTGNGTYENLAEGIEDWLRSLQDSDGGLWGGYDAEGELIGKNTEGIIDAYNAVRGYDDFHRDVLQYLEDERWDSLDKNLMSTPGHPQFQYALDLHSWAFSIFEDYPVSTLSDADRFLTTKVSTASNENITGYCFDEDQDVVWLEGTGEMVVAFNVAGMESQASIYLEEMEKLIIDSAIHEDSAGIPYAANPGTGFGDFDLWDLVDTVPVIPSSAWYLFGRSGFNPFSSGRNKNTPAEDKFWLDQ